MGKNLRVHEVAKALGLSAKNLMAELAKHGFEYKTHMAAIDSKALDEVKKAYPDLDAQLKRVAEEEAAAPKKQPKPRKKKAKVISQRSIAKKEEELEKTAVKKTGSVEIVQDKEGESVEQKVISGGIIRRRRVETPLEPQKPSEEKTAHEAQAPQPQNESAEKVTETPKTASEEIGAQTPRKFEHKKRLKVAEPVVPTPTKFIKEEVIERPAPRPSALRPKTSAPASPSRPTQPSLPAGRDLSAKSRLKIVGTSTPASERPSVQRPLVNKGKPSTSGAEVRPDEAKASAAKESEAAKKKSASMKNWVAPKVTKKDLFGMTEEVEITRPMGRRPKRQQRSDNKTKITTPSEAKRKIKISGSISVAELADRMGLKAAEVVRKLVKMGHMTSAHQSLDFDTATLIAVEYGYETQNVEITAESVIEEAIRATEADDPSKLKSRPPVVTIMGHVDHGKTSLLDYIRKAKVVAGEAGGITQHIGAYQVEQDGKKITFLDTPGHHSFSKMRARGASVTDIVILVVAADEGPKPQTLEALAHARDAKVPIIVALTKIDKPEANPDKVIQELSAYELIPEAWGGDTIFVRCSAHTGDGVSELLEMILLQAEVLEMKANPDRSAEATVIESFLDRGKGPVATVVVTKGTLKRGDHIVCGTSFGKVRGLFNDHGKMIKEALPAQPVEVLGLNTVPEAGDTLHAVAEESIARKASDLQSLAKKEEEARKKSRISLEEMFSRMKSGEMNELRVILKADVQGSVEAISDSLEKIKHDEVQVNVIFKAAGGITESDISLAAASGAIVMGFNVRPAGNAKSLAERENIQIKTYSVIYELLDDVKSAMEGLLAPDIKEEVVGQVEVRDVFNLSKVGVIAGCFVKSGKVERNAHARLIRDDVVIYDDQIQSVRRFKEDVKEVAEGFECGVRLENYTDIKAGDVIECYRKVEVKKAVIG